MPENSRKQDPDEIVNTLSRAGALSAVEYLKAQQLLEKEAREALPYSPDNCTYNLGPRKQLVYACLTCLDHSNTPVGICYSCSIKCHYNHELVELFMKRNFTCDCGTEKTSRGFGPCRIRSRPGADCDPDNSGNVYGHNFYGRFCSCDELYDPNTETGTMVQCLLGDACQEDWYHDRCVLGVVEADERREILAGYGVDETRSGGGEEGKGGKDGKDGEDEGKSGKLGNDGGKDGEDEGKDGIKGGTDGKDGGKERNDGKDSGNHGIKDLPAGNVGKDNGKTKVKTETCKPPETTVNSPEDSEFQPDAFPATSSFEHFICWRCVDKHRAVLQNWPAWPAVCLPPLYRLSAEPTRKRLKRETSPQSAPPSAPLCPEEITLLGMDAIATPPTPPAPLSFSLFLKAGYRDHFRRLRDEILANMVGKPEYSSYATQLSRFLHQFPFFSEEEAAYEPPPDSSASEDEEDVGNAEETAGPAAESLMRKSARLLETLPREKAIESTLAFNSLKNRLKSFLDPFAQSGEVVTKEKIQDFFADLKKK